MVSGSETTHLDHFDMFSSKLLSVLTRNKG